MSATVEDLLRRAADDPDSRESALDAAFALAAADGRWIDLLRGLRKAGLVTPARLDAALAGTLEEGLRTGAVWNFRESARAQAEERRDLEAAAAALAQGVAEMEGRKSVLGLCLLAEELADTLADVDGVTRALALAEPMATGFADRVLVATTTAKTLGDKAHAQALLVALPSPTKAMETWVLGNGWRELGAPETAARLLGEAEARVKADPRPWANPVAEALTLARAWRSWEDNEGSGRCLELAEALAKTPEQLLDIAETCVDFNESSPLADRAIAEAERRAVTGRLGQPRPLDEAVRARLIPLYLWRGKGEEASRLSPAGLRPDQLKIQHRRLEGWTPDPCGLFDALRVRLTEQQLRTIAGADYGSEFALHLANLQQIVESGRVPGRLLWNPGEVLRLCRWADGERTDHIQRAFCVTVICLCSDQDFLGSDAVILVDSALVLGGAWLALSDGLLAWIYSTLPDWEHGDQIVVLWALALLAAARDPADPRLHTLAGHIERLAAVEDWNQPNSLELAWTYSQRKPLWRSLIERHLRPASARPALRRILEHQ